MPNLFDRIRQIQRDVQGFSAWKASVHAILGRLQMQIDDLNNAINALSTQVSSAVAAIQAETAALAEAHANSDTAGVTGAIDRINALTAQLAAAVPAAPAPAPVDAPAPPVAPADPAAQ